MQLSVHNDLFTSPARETMQRPTQSLICILQERRKVLLDAVRLQANFHRLSDCMWAMFPAYTARCQWRTWRQSTAGVDLLPFTMCTRNGNSVFGQKCVFQPSDKRDLTMSIVSTFCLTSVTWNNSFSKSLLAVHKGGSIFIIYLHFTASDLLYSFCLYLE